MKRLSILLSLTLAAIAFLVLFARNPYSALSPPLPPPPSSPSAEEQRLSYSNRIHSPKDLLSFLKYQISQQMYMILWEMEHRGNFDGDTITAELAIMCRPLAERDRELREWLDSRIPILERVGQTDQR